MSDVKWVKIQTDIYRNRKINIIRQERQGEKYILLWFYLIVLAGESNSNGRLMYSETQPFTQELVANVLQMRIEHVVNGLKVFEKHEMIVIEDGIIELLGWSEYQNAEALERQREATRRRVAKYRSSKAPCNANVTQVCNVTESYGNALDKNRLEVDVEEKRKEEEEKNVSLSLIPSLKKETVTLDDETEMDASLSFVGYLPEIMNDMVRDKVIDYEKKEDYEKLILSFKNQISIFALEKIIRDFSRVVFQMELDEPTKYQTLQLTLKTNSQSM